MATASGTMSGEVVVESCGLTHIKLARYRYTWIIDHFSFYFNTMHGEKIESPEISDESTDGLKWKLEINSNGWCNEDDPDTRYMSFHLLLVSPTEDGKDIKTNFKLSILNKNSEPVHTFEDNQRFGKEKIHGTNSFFRKGRLLNDKDEIYPNDKLTMLCEISASLGFQPTSISKKFIQSQNIPVLKDFSFLLGNSHLSDVTIIVDDKKYHAHKVILAAQSSYFKSHFEKNKNEKKIEINGMKHGTFDQVLRYIYTNEISNLQDLTPDILAAASEYKLDQLKTMYVEAMLKNLSIENAALYFELGEKFNIPEMKLKAESFICANPLDVIKTSDWDKMAKTQPKLVTEIVCGLGKAKISSVP